MRTFIRRSVPRLICFLFLFFSLSLSLEVQAAVDTGLEKTANVAGFETGITLQEFIGYGIQAVLALVGAVFFAILVYGGILWMLSDGEQGKITKARGMIFYAVAGLFVVLGAYAVTNFVTTQIAERALK